MATISAKDTYAGTSIVERVTKNVDRVAAENMRQKREQRESAERIAFLYSQLFRNVAIGDRDVGRLRTEDEAREMFSLALHNANNHLQVRILREAIDNRWASVVQAFVKAWDGEHPIAKTVQELWALTLTTGRASA